MTATRPAPAVQPPSAPRPQPLLVVAIRALRPRQWVKNLLVVGAPLAAGKLLEVSVLRSTSLAFLAFCLAASCGYLVNDVHDAAEDRLHPVKRHRPVASGALPVPAALTLAVVLGIASLATAAACSTMFVVLLVAYLGVTLGYTLRLRREPIVDLVVVALGFVLRGAAGGVASGIVISPWFLLVAGFGALFLVSCKRYSELVSREPGTGGRAALATYTPEFLRFVWSLAATVTLVAYLLWATAVFVIRDEGSWAMWSVVPFLLGVLRYAFEIDRGAAEAPEAVLLGNRSLQLLALAWLVMVAVGAEGALLS